MSLIATARSCSSRSWRACAQRCAPPSRVPRSQSPSAVSSTRLGSTTSTCRYNPGPPLASKEKDWLYFPRALVELAVGTGSVLAVRPWCWRHWHQNKRHRVTRVVCPSIWRCFLCVRARWRRRRRQLARRAGPRCLPPTDQGLQANLIGVISLRRPWSSRWISCS